MLLRIVRHTPEFITENQRQFLLSYFDLINRSSIRVGISDQNPVSPLMQCFKTFFSVVDGAVAIAMERHPFVRSFKHTRINVILRLLFYDVYILETHAFCGSDHCTRIL